MNCSRGLHPRESHDVRYGACMRDIRTIASNRWGKIGRTAHRDVGERHENVDAVGSQMSPGANVVTVAVPRLCR